MIDSVFLPTSFYFAISIDADADPATSDGSFQDVSGIGPEFETEAYAEGGENRFVHQLPKGIKHPRLVLKRGLVATASPLLTWAKQTLEGDLATKILTRTVLVNLLDPSGIPLRSWRFSAAYPVRWDVEAFSSTTDIVAVETLEIAYATMTRAL